MRTVKIQCVGASPILMDPMTDDTLTSLITGVRPNKPKDRPLIEVCQEKLYREFGDTGRVGIPAECLFACLVAAGRNVKNGKKQVSTATSTTIPGLMSIKSFFMPFTNVVEGEDGKAWRVDKRRGQLDNGGKKVAVGIVRPRFDAWEFDVEVEFDDKIVNESVIRALFEDAGKNQGLGSFRPNKKGPFGTFKVTKFEVLKSETVEDLAVAA